MGLSSITADTASYKLPSPHVPAMATKDGGAKDTSLAAQVAQANSMDTSANSKTVAPWC